MIYIYNNIIISSSTSQRRKSRNDNDCDMDNCEINTDYDMETEIDVDAHEKHVDGMIGRSEWYKKTALLMLSDPERGVMNSTFATSRSVALTVGIARSTTDSARTILSEVEKCLMQKHGATPVMHYGDGDSVYVMNVAEKTFYGSLRSSGPAEMTVGRMHSEPTRLEVPEEIDLDSCMYSPDGKRLSSIHVAFLCVNPRIDPVD